MTVQEPISSPDNKNTPRRWVPDDFAYMIPMAAFLLLTWPGGNWPSFFPASYIIKTLLTSALLIWLWPQYTKINWSYAWLGVIIGVIGLVQWVGMEKFLLHVWPNYPRAHPEVLDPFATFSSPVFLWIFITIRLLGPTLVVPFMEEFFWRDFLWRTISAPNDFKMAAVGEWDPKAFFIVTAVFASVHMQMWITAFVWGAMIGLLLVRTKSLGACIIAHGVTNLLLGLYVVYTHDWAFW
jgi:CAAX prenyl protease-like protein